ncbi:NADH-ubiquinone oxidoreductase [Actinidia chinensis var. chinensis]|uniref:NADH-ubiquinone oxidoreductase n=1 Tax=Actinidia chinensis var. chinensis TaxID=1590841 RepID=A0A2R6PBR6_ACTCC|nr:NADH-ubiquinone oxidoreductase [Actinidia chinensis var. chinensis]
MTRRLQMATLRVDWNAQYAGNPLILSRMLCPMVWSHHMQKTVLGINCAALKFSNQQIQILFFISCPWCHLLTLRPFYKGNLKFRRKNFFLLWMVKSLNGDRMKSPLSTSANNQSVWSLRSPLFFANQASNNYLRRALHTHGLGRSSDSLNGRGPISRFTSGLTSLFALRQNSHLSFYCSWVLAIIAGIVILTHLPGELFPEPILRFLFLCKIPPTRFVFIALCLYV